jgi:cell division protease FtsH|uniref:AAA+ ATPase domain-containing protein n=1 Tax=viral metagenome TaxID=1070528 RepID=A0A6C0M050_9ZZZZ
MLLRNITINRFKTSVLPPFIDYIIHPDPPAIEQKLITVPYSRFLDKVKQHQIDKVVVRQDLSELIDDINERVILPSNSSIIDFLIQNKVNVAVIENDNIISNIMIGLQITFFFLLLRSLLGRVNIPNIVSKYEPNKDKPDVTFNDVAGIDNAKHDLQELVSFLKEPDKYTTIGATIPKGILLVGPSGVGKTLLAKAVAGESGVPFFSCSASEFIELFVGMGASRIRELFKKANANTPCIIFIDELDAIGKKRSVNVIGNNEQDQTLNQLLTELDGFNSNNGIIVIGATNRVDILDEALLRPGRFDRKVYIELPDVKGRLSILKVHTKNKVLSENINLEKIAKITVGFSGADLANLINEAAILSIRENINFINNVMIEKALEKITIGDEKNTILSKNKKKIIAFHEAGHALMGILVNDYDIVRKVSIVPRGRAGGITYFEPSEERLDISLMTREYLENKIMVALGGRIAEEIIFGTMKITTGSSSDLEIVNTLARDMVTRYGFNETLGPVRLSEISDNTQTAIDKEVQFLIEKLYIKAKNYLLKYEFYLHRIAEALLDKETLNEEDINLLTFGLDCDYICNDGGF